VSARGLTRDPEFQNRPAHRTALFARPRFAYVAALLAMVSVLTFYLGYAYGRQVVRIVVATVVPEKYGGGELSRFVRQEKNNSKVVVFVHGVTGTPTSTWTFKGNGVSAYWPKIVEQDSDLNGYDIFVMSYYSPQLQEGPGIFQLADSLYKELVEHGIYPDKSGTGVYKEVIFVCHSMANLILRNMMITNPLPNNSSTSVPLVLSIASPSAGSALAELVANIADNTVYQEMAKAEKNSYLQLLNGVWRKASFDTEIACAFERKEYAPLGKRVVDQTSATSVCTREDTVGIDEDHITIVKPPSKDHDIHKWLVREIRRPIQKRAWELDRWVNNEIIVAGKDFAESNMHAAMIAAVVRAHLPDLKVTVKYNLGNASRLYSALLDRRIDIYAEYDGSLLHEYLRRPLPGEPGAPPVGDTVEIVNREMEKELQTLTIKYLPHFGFDDPYVFVMLRAKAQELGILEPEGRVRASNLATVVAKLELFSDQEFFSRNEWAALKEKYGWAAMKTEFAQHTGIYERLRASKSQQTGAIIVGFGSDAELHEFNGDITIIEDDKKVLPNYYAAPFLDKRLLRRFPGLEEALRKLAGTITQREMSGLLATYKARLGDAASPGAAKTLEKVVADFMDQKGIPNKPPGQ
jgi:glycine betaine/choline ABC-type transport system substrate-binding protein